MHDLAAYHSQQSSLPPPHLFEAGLNNLSLVEDDVKHRILLFFLFLICIPLASAQLYTITDLGPLSPTAINVWDQVAGNYNGHAYLWQFGQGMRDLGTLPGGTGSYAASINDLGVVTGTADGAGTVISPESSIPNAECSDLTQPFVWTPWNGMKGLGTLGVPPAETMSPYWCTVPFYGTGVNIHEQVVGYTTLYSDNYQWGFLWTNAAGMSLYGGSFPPTMSNGISDNGETVGQSGVLIGEAAFWNAGVETDLGTLGGTGLDYSSSANGVTDWGRVVGWSTTESLVTDCGLDLVGCTIHAVVWTKAGVISDLGTLPGDTLSAASNINYWGKVIGSSGNTLVQLGWGGTGGSGFDGDGGAVAVVGRPFLWTERKGMRDLNTLIRAGSGWVLNSVSGINVWGQIVGSGTLNGETHGFLLTP
jgi:uncharacterized membrane protein